MKRSIYVVCDHNVRALAEEVSEGRPIFEITADEDHKNIDTVLGICRWLLAQGADRNSLIYAVGGGVTTDMVGFASSIYKRGVRYANFPTTLLCQVDAGIGGKTGVNLDGYKNMLGVTRFPVLTRILPNALKTLPERELRSGAAEMLKTFIIEDKGNYERAVAVLSKKEINYAELNNLVLAAGAVKRRIVEKDPYEEGLRRVLNLGHTYGHAIEWYQHTHSTAAEGSGNCTGDCGSTPLTHGEAVAIGIIKAAQISENLRIAKPGLADKLMADFRSCGLPTGLPCPEEELETAIWKDKKVENGILHFVLIKKIGKVIIQDLDDLHKYSE